MTREQREAELDIAKQNRAIIWRKLKELYPEGKTPKGDDYQYFNFKYDDLTLRVRVDVYIVEDDIKKYGGNVVVSFDTAAFNGSGFIIPNNRTPEIHKGNDKERIYFYKEIGLDQSTDFYETIQWIRDVVADIVSLYKTVNCKQIVK